tara:strand:- start:531 stop:1877 length:1347 start_codon:yes stop_codon:yes gene_type:complete
MRYSVNTDFYLNAYPDLRQNLHTNIKHNLNDRLNQHYNECGKNENRLACENQFYDMYPDFDISYYVKYNRDLKKLCREELLAHFHMYGHIEGRKYKNESRFQFTPDKEKYIPEINFTKSKILNIKEYDEHDFKLSIISEDTWICKRLRKEYENMNKNFIADKIEDADIVWIISSWEINKNIRKKLENKIVVITIHHIDSEKIKDIGEYMKNLEEIASVYHIIDMGTYNKIKNYTEKKIFYQPFWVDENDFYEIKDKKKIREKHNLNRDSFLVGSFQRDTEGNSIQNKNYEPKLSKGPDIFCDVIKILSKKYSNLTVLLTGYRRQYIMSELDKLGIKYYYKELVSVKELNELYNCLDLYVISSRTEGGPKALFECAITKTPLISTPVGATDEIIHPDNIYLPINIEQVLNTEFYTDFSYDNVQKYVTSNSNNIFNNFFSTCKSLFSKDI